MANGTGFDLSSLFSGGLGGTPSGLDALLTEDQRKLMGRNATLSAAAALLQASGRSAVPISLGQALGGALQAGQQGYQQARAGSLQDLLVGQKLTEAQQETAFNKRIRDALYPTTPAAGAIPQETGAQMPLPRTDIDGPGVQVFAPDAPRAAAPAQPSAIRPSGMFANLTPEQRAIAAFNPKVMLPKIFEESLKADTFRPMKKEEVTAMGLDPRSVYQINTRTNEPKLLKGYEGAFGSSLQGNAYDTLLTKDENSPEYALAYRILSQPVPVEKLQADGSTKTVYEQPAPLPGSFARPTYKGKLPAAPAAGAAPSGAQIPAGGAMPSGAQAPAQAAPGGPIEAQPGSFPGAGGKSSPFAPSVGQVTEARKQALVIDKLMGSLDALEKNVQQNGMQIGGMGALGATQEALFQDSILQLKELQNLGVLQGRDEAILIQQLSNPTSLMTYIKGLGGPDYFFAKVKELKSKAERELSMINRQFPVPVTGQQPVTPAMPQRFSAPPGIGDILKKYPGAGGG
jgi:hypothetical protein